MPSGLTLPWLLLALATIADRWKEMVQTHRSDTTTFASMLIVITVLLGSLTSATGVRRDFRSVFSACSRQTRIPLSPRGASAGWLVQHLF